MDRAAPNTNLYQSAKADRNGPLFFSETLVTNFKIQFFIAAVHFD